MDKMLERITQVAKERSQRIDERLKTIVTPLLGDRASEFNALLQKSDINGLTEMLSPLNIRIEIYFRRLEKEGKHLDGWFVPTREYTVYQGDRVVGSFQDI